MPPPRQASMLRLEPARAFDVLSRLHRFSQTHIGGVVMESLPAFETSDVSAVGFGAALVCRRDRSRDVPMAATKQVQHIPRIPTPRNKMPAWVSRCKRFGGAGKSQLES
jgi:hypothetical protein